MSADRNANGVTHTDIGALREDNSETVFSITNSGKYTLPFFERFPPEIMGLIFRWCLDGEILFLPICYDCSTVTMPWALGQVCSRWRDILMNDSTVWSSLTISYESVRDKEALTRKVKEMILPRSKHDLISLTCSNMEFRDDATYHTNAISTIVMPNLEKFRNLTLSMAREELDPLITSPPDLLASLESVKLCFTWTSFSTLEDFDFHPDSITVFERAPKLRKVHFTGFYFCEFQGKNPLTLPWSQLTDIEITINLPFTAVLKFLPFCMQLVNCWLSFGSMDDRINQRPLLGQITLPSLRSITLCSAYAGTLACPNLLQLLILPALKDFTLHLYDRIFVQEILLALIQRSGCRLERFEVTGYFEDSLNNAATLLEAMPSLKRLVLPRDYVLPMPTIERIMAGELVLGLEAIHCQVASLPLMLQLIESRRSGKSAESRESYKGIRCSVLWGRGMLECKCET
ncbi:hypothetical protein BDZ94DRAFT_1261823 [Collybia nuda]|uniref:F-box domain-containing protein n=1 Tax=Collybia nuda TaxID=64659 RepID=A0A9P5Y6U7_9AGAR|nr:hypothetical protein BDZ94DRAFT_1261823 [Collybia nuda]